MLALYSLRCATFAPSSPPLAWHPHCLRRSFIRAPANLPGNEELFPLDDRLGFEQCCNRPQSQQLRGMQARITDPWRSRLELPPSPRSTTPAHLPLERAPLPSLTYRLPLLQVEAPAAASPPSPAQKAGSPRPVGGAVRGAASSGWIPPLPALIFSIVDIIPRGLARESASPPPSNAPPRPPLPPRLLLQPSLA